MKYCAALVIATILGASVAVIVYPTADERGNGLGFERTMDSLVEISCSGEGAPDVFGTGFVVERGGLFVLTVAHVISAGSYGETDVYETIIGRMADGTEHALVPVAIDKDADLALLRFIDGLGTEPLELDTDVPEYGEDVSVLGNAMGYGISVKTGVVSIPWLEMKVNGSARGCVMTSITLNRGDSGAPIIDGEGRVLGIASFGLREEGKSLNGIGFGIRSAEIARFLETR